MPDVSGGAVNYDRVARAVSVVCVNGAKSLALSTRTFGRIAEAGGKVLRLAYVDRRDSRYMLSSHVDARDTEAQLMRMTYDSATDAVYLYLTERSQARRMSRAGIEVLAVSRLPDAKPMQMVFEILTPSDAVAAAE